MAKPEEFDIQVVIDHMQGTSNTLDGALQTIYGDEIEYEDLTTEDHAQIDNQIFLCDECGWWCEQSEASEIEDEKCQDCAGDL